jgi:hypothetical protein
MMRNRIALITAGTVLAAGAFFGGVAASAGPTTNAKERVVISVIVVGASATGLVKGATHSLAWIDGYANGKWWLANQDAAPPNQPQFQVMCGAVNVRQSGYMPLYDGAGQWVKGCAAAVKVAGIVG